MNGYLIKIVAGVAVSGVLGAVGVYATQGRIDVRVTHNKERIVALEQRQTVELQAQREMFREFLDRVVE